MPKDPMDEMFKEEERGSSSEQPDSAAPQNDSREISTGEIIGGIAVVVFFIAEIVAMAIFSRTNPSLCVACLGSLLLVFGIAGVIQAKITWDSWPILIVPIVGLLLTVLPIMDHISRKNTGETFLTQDVIVLLISSGFFLIGSAMAILPLLKRHFLLKKCTETVMAKCVYLDSHINRGNRRNRRSYAPKWEYVVDGKVYEHQETIYTNVHVPNVGEEYEIFVNPQDPSQIYRHNPFAAVVSLLIGIIAAGLGILAIYSVFFM